MDIMTKFISGKKDKVTDMRKWDYLLGCCLLCRSCKVQDSKISTELALSVM